jgi:hypothetical protein
MWSLMRLNLLRSVSVASTYCNLIFSLSLSLSPLSSDILYKPLICV